MPDLQTLTLALPYVMQAAAGAVGGNIAGMVRRTEGWGPLLNSVLGAAGGLIAAQALSTTGQVSVAAGYVGGNFAAVEAGAAAAAGTLLALASSAFKQPD